MPALLRSSLLFLLLGAILAIVMAWACAIFLPNRGTLGHDVGPGLSDQQLPCWALVRYDQFGSTLLAGDAVLVEDEGEPMFDFLGEKTMSSYLPYWSRMNEPPLDRSGAVETAYGWPLRALMC